MGFLGRIMVRGPGQNFFRQGVGRGGDMLAVALQPCGVGHMDDEGVILGTALGLENAAHRILVQAVGAQAVDRLRGNAEKAAPTQDRGCLLNGMVIFFRMKNGCFHTIRLELSI